VAKGSAAPLSIGEELGFLSPRQVMGILQQPTLMGKDLEFIPLVEGSEGGSFSSVLRGG